MVLGISNKIKHKKKISKPIEFGLAGLFLFEKLTLSYSPALKFIPAV